MRVVVTAEVGAVDDEAEARRDVVLPAATLAVLAAPSTVPGVGAGDDGNEAVSLILRCANSDSKSSYGSENSSGKRCSAKLSEGGSNCKGAGVAELVEAVVLVLTGLGVGRDKISGSVSWQT